MFKNNKGNIFIIIIILKEKLKMKVKVFNNEKNAFETYKVIDRSLSNNSNEMDWFFLCVDKSGLFKTFRMSECIMINDDKKTKKKKNTDEKVTSDSDKQKSQWD